MGKSGKHETPAAMRRKQQYLLLSVLFSFLLGVGMLVGVIHTTREHARRLAELYLSDVTWELVHGEKTTDSLVEIIKDSEGDEDSFFTGAHALQLQNPIVKFFAFALADGSWKAYPHDEGSAYSRVWVSDAVRKEIYINQNSGNMLFNGPFPVANHDNVFLISKPVYRGIGGKKQFCGEVFAVLSLNRLIQEETIFELGNEGYHYRLLQVGPHNSRVLTANINEELAYPLVVSEQGYGYTWKLQVEPKNGWITPGIVMLAIAVIGMGGVVLYTLYDLAGLRARTEELNAETNWLRKESVIDPLTRIYNRRGFEIEANRMLQQNKSCILAFLDINDYKIYNDVYGHEAGDDALRLLAQELTRLMKEFNGVTGRVGGDEFSVLIPGTSESRIRRLEEWTDKKHVVTTHGVSFEFGVSVGYAFYPAHGLGLMDLMQKADKAAYHVKRIKGINSFCYNPSLEQEQRQRFGMGFSIKDIEYGIPAGIIICEADPKGRILFANRDTMQLLGYEEESGSLVGKPWMDCILPEDRNNVLSAIEEYRTLYGEQDEKGHYRAVRKKLRFHVQQRDGNIKEVISLGRVMYNVHYGEIYFVLLVETGN